MVAKPNQFQIYDPALADTLGLAFDEAWSVLERSEPDLSHQSATAMREAIASRIIQKAQQGERGLEQLRDDAVEHVTRTIFRKSASLSR
jgi:hypothetical protein